MNNVNLIGRVSSDINYKKLKDRTSFVSFSLAVDRVHGKKRKELENRDYQVTDFFLLNVYGAIVDSLVQPYINKGDLIAIRGELRSDKVINKDNTISYINKILVRQIRIINGKSQNKVVNRELPSIEEFKDLTDELVTI